MDLHFSFLIISTLFTVKINSQLETFSPIINTVFTKANGILRNNYQNPDEGFIEDTAVFEDKYDFIVIGAGSGGSVVANRLSEVPEWEVLLLEAGDDETFFSDIPIAAAMQQLTSMNWGFKTNKLPGACLSLKNEVCNLPRGRVLGGTSVINFLVYGRGNKLDYDNWEATGNEGWSYKDVLPYFKKSENIQSSDLKRSKYHGTSGYLTVGNSPYTSKIFDYFIQAAKELGYKLTDPNGHQNIGVSKILATMRNGRRCSASKAFLQPARNRRNLHISKLSRVIQILINPETKQAYGVKFIKNRKKYIVKVRKEVILAAGAIGSPHLLMLSGVGPKKNLEEFNIPVIKDSMVGYNLQDHICFAGITFFINDTLSLNMDVLQNPSNLLDYLLNGRGPLTLPGGGEGVIYSKSKYDTNKTNDHPDFELVIGPGGLSQDSSGVLEALIGLKEDFKKTLLKGVENVDGFSITPVLLRPHSRGRISLRSANPFYWPSLQTNYLQDVRDVQIIREAAKEAMRLASTSSFQKIGSKIIQRKYVDCEQFEFNSDEHLECAIRHYTVTLSHLSGTTKMGPTSDPTSVVDPTLKVIGISGLRVVDASIMPIIPTGHTNAIVYMIGEKGSDLIKKDWGIQPDLL